MNMYEGVCLRGNFCLSCLSGGLTPCRHLRPSSGRELIQAGDDDYLMNKTRRKPTTGTGCAALFDKWHRIFYMPSRIDTAGHTKAFDYPIMDHFPVSRQGDLEEI